MFVLVLGRAPPAIHDFDEIGIPSGATKRFRDEANERWVRRALEYQHAGVRAEWMRRHAAYPRHLPEVLSEDGSPAMRWERWSAWLPGDPRWHVHVIDSSSVSVDEVAAELRAWVSAERARYSITSSSTGRAAGALSASS